MTRACRKAHQLIQESLSAPRSDVDKRWLDGHLHTCAGCAAARRELTAIAVALREAPRLPMPEESAERVRSRLDREQWTAPRKPCLGALRLAFAVAVVCAAVACWRLWPERLVSSTAPVVVARAQPPKETAPVEAEADVRPVRSTPAPAEAPRSQRPVAGAQRQRRLAPAVSREPGPETTVPATDTLRIYEEIILAAQTGGLTLEQYRSGLNAEPKPDPKLAAARAAAAVGEVAQAAAAYEDALAEPPLRLVMRAPDMADDVRILAALGETPSGPPPIERGAL